MTGEELISVGDIAARFDKRAQTIFKIMKRLDISGKKQRDPSRGNQLVSYVTKAEGERIRSELLTSGSRSADGNLRENDEIFDSEKGVFYLIQLEPDHDPNRFKVGFAQNIAERLRSHRCSTPFAVVVKTWPCKRTWERTVIDCVTIDCEQIHTEVFRCESLNDVMVRCEAFFAVMPIVDDPRNTPAP